MIDAPENNPITFNSFLRELTGADRVVIETWNSLAEMDAQYMPASEVLSVLQAAIAEEREACAALAESRHLQWDELSLHCEGPGEEIAAAIRARGET